jgi:hypothetical protein
MTPSGIETATCRFVAYCLNHYATARPLMIYGDFSNVLILYVQANTYNIVAPSLYRCSSEKAMSITYSKCLSVALIIQQAKHLRHITLSSAPIWLYHVSTYGLLKGTILGEKITEHKIRILIFSTTFV